MYDLMRPIQDNFYMSEGIIRYSLIRGHAVPSISPSVHYASGLFEGMSIIALRNGPRLKLGLFHPALNFERLRHNLKGLGYDWELYSDEQIIESIFTICALNSWNNVIELEGANTVISSGDKEYQRIYVRPLVYSNYNGIGIVEPRNIELMLNLAPMGEYIPCSDPAGTTALLYPQPRYLAFPQFKVSSNYQLSIHAKTMLTAYNKTNDLKCEEVVFQNTKGNLTEGTGENLVLLKDNELITPPPSEGALPGITYRIVFLIANELGTKARFGTFKYSDIESADALFFTGNAAGIVPIKRIVRVDSKYSTLDYMDCKEGGKNNLMSKLKSEYNRVLLGDTAYGSFFTYLDEWLDENRLAELNDLGLEFKRRLTEENRRYDGTNSSVLSFMEITPRIAVERKYFDDKKWMIERLGIRNFLK
ncbi:MAG: aminotransferase class IV [Candidatus Micrarchaeia archaeon]